MLALIMAGGSGTRFWPLSRQNFPKQYLQLFEGKSMIRLTYERLLPKIKRSDIFVITTAAQRELVQKELPELRVENIICEPLGRNTAPCIALALSSLAKIRATDETLLVLPADNLIKETDLFVDAVTAGEVLAKDDYLVTFGVKPDYAATGYGYIKAGMSLETGFLIEIFKEKPDLPTAQQYLAQGNFFWNSGMFLFKLTTVEKNYRKFAPRILELIEEMKTDPLLYEQMPKIPFDIAIMEKAEKRAVIPVNFTWSDVGGYQAMHTLEEKDAFSNSVSAKIIAHKATNCLVRSQKPIVLLGVENLAVIETDDALLICNLAESEEIKNVLFALSKNYPQLL